MFIGSLVGVNDSLLLVQKTLTHAVPYASCFCFWFSFLNFCLRSSWGLLTHHSPPVPIRHNNLIFPNFPSFFFLKKNSLSFRLFHIFLSSFFLLIDYASKFMHIHQNALGFFFSSNALCFFHLSRCIHKS